MSRTGEIRTWVENPLFNDEDQPEEIELIIGYTFTPGYKQTWEEPGQGPEIELFDIRRADTGEVATLSPTQREHVEEKIEEEQDNGPDPDEGRDQDLEDRRLGVGRYEACAGDDF